MIIMNLRKILGLRTTQEKINDYRAQKQRLAEIETIGRELSERFMIQKSMIDEIDSLPENKRSEIFSRYEGFVSEHKKEVTKAMNERNQILKSLSKLKADDEIREALQNIDAIENAALAYRKGRIKKAVYFDIVKSLTGEPVKYADVIARNRDGQILILHRVTDYAPNGTVCIPGGHVDPGEDFQTAALREFKEETNLDPIPGMGIRELGEYRSDDAHIKYYEVQVDSTQPVTVDSSEHCFAEWINIEEIPLKPFIFDQGKNVLKMLYKPHQLQAVQPLMKALDEGKIEPSVFALSFSSLIEKAMDTESEKPLIPESMDGEVKRKAVFPVRDPERSVEQIMKAVNGNSEVMVGGELKFSRPMNVHEVNYRNDPGNNRLTEVEVVFTGDEVDMKKLIEEMKYGFMVGGVQVKTPHEEFMSVNENGTNYVGDPVFVDF